MMLSFRLWSVLLVWGVVALVNVASGEEPPAEPAADGISVVQLPDPVPPVARRGPDRTIDIAGLDRIHRVAFAPDGRTLWLLGEDDPPGTPRDPATTWPRVLGLDLVSGVISQDLRLPRRAGVLSLGDLVVTEKTVWASGSYRTHVAKTPADPELVIPGQPRFFIWSPSGHQAEQQGFVATATIGQPGEVRCRFDDEDQYASQIGLMELEQSRLDQQRFQIGREAEPEHTRYRFYDPTTGRPRLEVLAGNNLNATLSRSGRYLTVRRYERRSNSHTTIWRYDAVERAWGWPRAVRGKNRSLYAVSPDGTAAAIVGAEGIANRIDLYLFDDTERYDPTLAAQMAEVLATPRLSSTSPNPQRTVTLPGAEAELGPGPNASFPLEGLGRPWTIQLEADGSRAYIVHRVVGDGVPAPQEDRVRCVDLATGQTIWDVPCPFPWVHQINSYEGTGLVLDPHYLIFVNTHAVQRGGSTPDPIAPFHLRSEVRLLHKATGATRGTTYATAVHDSVYFSPVVLPPERPDAEHTKWPGSARLVLVRHARPPEVIDGQNDPEAWHWRIERWELPYGRRQVLMRSQIPRNYDGATLGFWPRIDTFALGDDEKSVVGLWSPQYRGMQADPRYADRMGALLRFDAKTGRRLGSIPLPVYEAESFIRQRIPGGLWQVNRPDMQTIDFWRLHPEEAATVLRVQTNGWNMWKWVTSRALWWDYQQVNGQGDRQALLRLDPWTGRVDGPRETRPLPSSADAKSWGVDLWAYAHDGSTAVALAYPKNNFSLRPPVTLHRYDYLPVAEPEAGE